MSKKNDIRLSKRESHQVPNSEARGLLNLAKKQEKIQKPKGSTFESQKTQKYIVWMMRIALGYLISGSMYGYSNPTIGYWVIYLICLVTFDSYKKEK